jgi:ABC-type amino acid transport substrate-binding protein
MKKTTRLVTALVALGLVAAACGGGTTPTTTPTTSDAPVPSIGIKKCQTVQGNQAPAEPKGVDFTTQLREAGKLHVGSDNDYPPWEEIKPGAKKPTGIDVDIYDEIATRLGLTAESTTTDFAALFTTSVPNGRFDIGMSAATITEERKRTVDFTIPYFRSDLSVAIDITRTPEITGVDDLAGKTIGAQTGTTGEICAKFLVKQGKAAEVKSFAKTGPAFQDLLAGRIAAVVNDQTASEGFVLKNSDSLKVVQIITTQEEYGIAVSKEHPDLRVAINDALTEMMTDGTYARIYEKWFKTPPPFDLPLS